MSEEPGFTPNSPLTRRPRKRSWLIVWVFVALIGVFGSFWILPAGVWRAVSAVLGFIGFVLGVRLVIADVRSRPHRGQWFGRMLDRY